MFGELPEFPKTTNSDACAIIEFLHTQNILISLREKYLDHEDAAGHMRPPGGGLAALQLDEILQVFASHN